MSSTSKQSSSTGAIMAIVPPFVRARHLSMPRTPLIGRAHEVAAVGDLLVHASAPLVTLTGPGGVGKTRLALAVASALREHFANDVWFVPLAPVRDPALVLPSIAQAMEIRDVGSRSPLEHLAAVLAERHCLLVLDNLEQVVTAAPLVAELLTACPKIQALITSREVLRVSGEHAFPVSPLALPDATDLTADELLSLDAARLFVERARAVQPTFTLTAATIPAVAAICRHLDGLPLALELAAARSSSLAPVELLARLEHRLPLLTGGPRDAPARLRTMRDAIAWSHDLLSPEEQAVFQRLAVFAGGFTLEAAEAVAPIDGLRAGDVAPSALPTSVGTAGAESGGGTPVGLGSRTSALDAIASLIDKSLLCHETGCNGTARYRMLEIIREYAAERLAASGEVDAARRAHVAYFLALVEPHQPAPFLPDDQAWLARLEEEHANLRAALTWLAEAGEASAFLRLAGALSWFWFVHGHVHDGRAWLERALAHGSAEPAEARARIAVVLGLIMMAQGDFQRAEELMEDGLALARSANDALGTAQALIAFGAHAATQGEHDRATTHLGEALALARSWDDRRLAVSIASAARANLGVALRGQGRLEAATTHHEEALAGQRAVGSVRGQILSLADLGDVARDQGDIALATARYRDGLTLAWAYGEKRAIAEALEGLACVAVAAGQALHAVRLFGATERLREQTGIIGWVPLNRAACERAQTAARAALGEETFASAWAAGRALTLEQAVAAALALDLPAAPMVSAGPSGVSLTPREAEVLRFLVQGRSDREIAEALAISPRTVNRHVTAILTKLGVENRTAATNYALRQGVV